MQIVKKLPPNINAIRQAGLKPTNRTVFTYGDTLYNPGGGAISDHLMAHEEQHSYQQSSYGVDEWWDEYLENEYFRGEQELEAYKEQYKVLLANHSREERRTILSKMAADLAGPMYGSLMTKEQAKEYITEE